jgi:hypothetical protein
MTAARPLRHEWFDAALESDDDAIDSYTIAVAASLYKHMNSYGGCYLSERTIAAASRCVRNTVANRIKRLEDAGYLVVSRHHRSRSGYHAGLPGGPALVHGVSQNGAATGSSDDQFGSPHGKSASRNAHGMSQSGSQGGHQQSEPFTGEQARRSGVRTGRTPRGRAGRSNGVKGVDVHQVWNRTITCIKDLQDKESAAAKNGNAAYSSAREYKRSIQDRLSEFRNMYRYRYGGEFCGMGVNGYVSDDKLLGLAYQASAVMESL